MDNFDYQQVLYELLKILWIAACMGQHEPDSHNCQICEDTSHQAFECRFNAFTLFQKEKS